MNEREQSVSEQVGVLPVVEPELEFVQVGAQVFLGELVIAPDDGPLEQRPRRLNAVRRHVAPNPFIGAVIHRLMVRKVGIGAGLVGVEPNSVHDGIGKERIDRACRGYGSLAYCLEANLSTFLQ